MTRLGAGPGQKAVPCRCCSCLALAERSSKAVATCGVTVATLLLCWAPLLASHVAEAWSGPGVVLHQVKLCGLALVLLGAALDPYLYAQARGGGRSRLGRALWGVLRCQCYLPAPPAPKRCASLRARHKRRTELDEKDIRFSLFLNRK